MNDDLKISFYQKIIRSANPDEEEAIKKTACVLFAKKCANCKKEIHFYSSDLLGDGIDTFLLEYNRYYSNGEFQHGDSLLDTDEIIKAYGFKSYDELKEYLSQKYVDDENAWSAIIKEFEDKGLKLNVDETEGEDGYSTNII